MSALRSLRLRLVGGAHRGGRVRDGRRLPLRRPQPAPEPDLRPARRGCEAIARTPAADAPGMHAGVQPSGRTSAGRCSTPRGSPTVRPAHTCCDARRRARCRSRAAGAACCRPASRDRPQPARRGRIGHGRTPRGRRPSWRSRCRARRRGHAVAAGRRREHRRGAGRAPDPDRDRRSRSPSPTVVGWGARGRRLAPRRQARVRVEPDRRRAASTSRSATRRPTSSAGWPGRST